MFDPLNVMEGTVGGVQPFAETLTAFEVALQPFDPVMVTIRSLGGNRDAACSGTVRPVVGVGAA